MRARTRCPGAWLPPVCFSSVPCLLKADSLASYKAVDEYGDEQTEEEEIRWKLVRGANIPDSITPWCNYFALIGAGDELELHFYAEVPTSYDSDTGEDVPVDVDAITFKITEFEDATDSECLLPSDYEIGDITVSTPEQGYGFQAVGTITNKTNHRWSNVTISFIALDADGNPYRFPYIEEGSVHETYANTESSADHIKPDGSGDLVCSATIPTYIYNTLADNYSSTLLDASQVFSIDAIDSVEVLGVVASFDDESDDE